MTEGETERESRKSLELEHSCSLSTIYPDRVARFYEAWVAKGVRHLPYEFAGNVYVVAVSSLTDTSG